MKGQGTRRAKRVLLAEDDEEARRLAAHVIEKLGHAVVEAKNGDELRYQIVEEHVLGKGIDVIVSDLRMPGTSALEVLEALDEADLALPFVLITAFGTNEVHERVRRLGGVVLEKPFDAASLREAIDGLDGRPGRAAGFTLVELMVVTAVIAIVTAIAIPNLVETRKHANATAAIGGLRTIATAEALFREGDKDGNGITDYGTLTQLSTTQLVDTVLGSGTKQGYTFKADRSSTQPQYLWFATANPMVPKMTGDRYFETNHEGVVFYTLASKLPQNTTTCTKSTGTIPVGK